MVNHVKYYVAINLLTADRALRVLIDFTLSNARRFYSLGRERVNSDDYQELFFETLVPQALRCDFSFNVEYECFMLKAVMQQVIYKSQILGSEWQNNWDDCQTSY